MGNFEIIKLSQFIENAEKAATFSISGVDGVSTMLTKTILISDMSLELLLEKLKLRQIHYYLVGKVINGQFEGVLEMKARTSEQLGMFL